MIRPIVQLPDRVLKTPALAVEVIDDHVRQVCTDMDDHELYRTLNMGIGMVIVCAPDDVAAVQASIDERTWVIGELVTGDRQVHLRR